MKLTVIVDIISYRTAPLNYCSCGKISVSKKLVRIRPPYDITAFETKAI